MSSKIALWISATRPRTLVLSSAGAILGGLIALSGGNANIWAWVLCVITAVLLQSLSNLANDYGDFEKGVDNTERVGPKRPLLKGMMNASEMKKAIITTAILSLISGAILVLCAAELSLTEILLFAVLGLGAIVAAMLYTLGKHPYGYRGLGDFYCFIFFGLVSVAGTFYLVTHQLDYTVLLPAAAMGFMSNAVLNINNMRDVENDKNSGKNSLVVKIGLKNAYLYHVGLIIGAFVMLVIYLIINNKSWYSYLFLLMMPLFIIDLVQIKKTPHTQIDPFLKKQAIKTFLLALVYGILCLFS